MRSLIAFLSTLFLGAVIVMGQSYVSQPRPLIFDELHYYTKDRAATERFFSEHFGARPLPHPGRTLDFITFLSLRGGEGTINVSSQGPFPGVDVGDPARWQRKVIQPSPTLPPMYGLRWSGISAGSLERVVARLEKQGVRILDRRLKLPHEPNVRAALIEGPDFNHLVVVERKDNFGSENRWGNFGLDHLLLLVKEAKANEKFFSEVYAGQAIKRLKGVIVMKVADARIVLAEPEAVGLRREQVVERDPREFRYGVDHIGFLYRDVKAAVAAAKAKGYQFKLEGAPLMYYGQPTVYLFAITFTPDGFQCEMVQQEGRLGARPIPAEFNR